MHLLVLPYIDFHIDVLRYLSIKLWVCSQMFKELEVPHIRKDQFWLHKTYE